MADLALGDRLPPKFWRAFSDALARTFWSKRTFGDFVVDHFFDEPELEALVRADATKVDMANDLVRALRSREEELRDQILEVARALAAEVDYDDLWRAERADDLVVEARLATAKLRDAMPSPTGAARPSAWSSPAGPGLNLPNPTLISESLAEDYLRLERVTSPHSRGKSFEHWLHEVFAEAGLSPSGSIEVEGEQIDDAIELDGNSWLVEAKWWKTAIQPAEIDGFAGKLSRRPASTFGLFVSDSGFTANAALLNSRAGRSIVLMTGVDVRQVARRQRGIVEILRFKRRQLVERGLSLAEMETP